MHSRKCLMCFNCGKSMWFTKKILDRTVIQEVVTSDIWNSFNFLCLFSVFTVTIDVKICFIWIMQTNVTSHKRSPYIASWAATLSQHQVLCRNIVCYNRGLSFIPYVETKAAMSLTSSLLKTSRFGECLARITSGQSDVRACARALSLNPNMARPYCPT